MRRVEVPDSEVLFSFTAAIIADAVANPWKKVAELCSRRSQVIVVDPDGGCRCFNSGPLRVGFFRCCFSWALGS